jgi:hypothetical protein
MLMPRTQGWTSRQRWLIVGAAVAGVMAFLALVYSYERYYRGPTEAALFGTWQDTLPAMDTITYYRFKPDGTFDIIVDGMGEVSVMATGTWYAGGSNLYWRLPEKVVGEPQRPLIWHIVDISPKEIHVRSFRDGAITVWKRVDDPLPPQASDQSVELTATRRAFTFQMTRIPLLRAPLALGGGSSLLSR